MKSRLMQIAEGKIESREPVLTFSDEKLKGAVLPDKVLKLEVEIGTESRLPLRMFFYSSNPRVAVAENVSLRERGKVEIEVDSRGLSIFDEIRGTIEVLYNGGEKSIPYLFTVGPEKGTRVLSTGTLEEFSRFARLHFDEAVTLFSVKEFTLLPFMKSLRMQGYYREFLNPNDPASGLREFLKAAGVAEFQKTAEKKAEKASGAPVKAELTAADREKRREKRILAAFLHYEIALHTGEDLEERGREIERLKALYPDDVYANLLLIYRDLQAEEHRLAKDVLLSIQDEVQKNRMDRRAEYGIFLYLAGVVQNDVERIRNAEKLIRKYYEEEPSSLILAMAEYRVNHDPANDPKEASDFLRQCWVRGLRSKAILESTALLYAEGNMTPDILGEYELLSVLTALRGGLLTVERLFRILRTDLAKASLLPLYFLVLKTGYRLFQHPDLLYAILDLFLQRKMTGQRYFSWYREGVFRGLTVPGMNEGFMLSIPKTEDEMIPESVIQYFGTHRIAEGIDRAFLYANVLTWYGEREDVMKMYRTKIDEFALRCMKEEQYSLPMKTVYRAVLSKDYLNAETAGPMLQVFSLREAVTGIPEAKCLHVYYPELDLEEQYDLDGDGRTLLPVYSEEAVFTVEGRNGKRFYDPELRFERCFVNEDLERQCLLYTGNSLLLKLREANGIVREGVLQDADLFFVMDLIRDRRVSPLFRTRLYETLIDYFLTAGAQRLDSTDFLKEADFLSFSREYRVKLIDLFLRENREGVALETALTYGREGLSDEALRRITELAVSDPNYERNPKVLSYAARLFRHDAASDRILAYLARHYNGPAAEMSNLLKTVRRRKISAGDLSERALAVALFTNRTKELDSMFDAHLALGNRNELVEKAYLVRRAHDYFIEKKRLGEICVRELKRRVLYLPKVALFALLTYFAENVQRLDEESRGLLKKLLLVAVEQDAVLKCFSAFEGLPEMPFELENRVFLEYRDQEASGVSMAGHVFPDKRAFHREMNEVYPGVFTQSFFLYEREWLQFSYVIRTSVDDLKETEDTVVMRKDRPVKRGGRYEELSLLEKKIATDDLKDAADYLKRMLEREAMIQEIFQ